MLRANTTYSITVSVTEDGDDDLILQGDTLSWSHLDLFANGGVCSVVTSGVCTNTTDAESETDYAGNAVDPVAPYILVSGTDSASVDFTNNTWYNGIQGFACSSDAGPLACP